MTKSNVNVGILGTGVHLPPQIRTNDHWPEAVRESWRRRPVVNAAPKDAPAGMTDGMKRVVAAMASLSEDPFLGARERRVLADDRHAGDMELEAARDALANAGVDPARIGLVLSYIPVPEHLNANTSCAIHEKLGLRPDCMAVTVDSACNSFLHQLGLAQAMIASGQVELALLTQAVAPSRVLPEDQGHAAWFGDGATAIVLGPVSEGRGFLSLAHRVDGTIPNALVVSVPGGRWYDEGRPVFHAKNQFGAMKTLLRTADSAKEVISEALARSGCRETDVDFYACHQGTGWLRAVTQAYTGMERAKSLDTFAWAGSLSAANVPLVLHLAAKEKVLLDGDLTVLYSGGTGITYSAAVLRWGR